MYCAELAQQKVEALGEGPSEEGAVVSRWKFKTPAIGIEFLCGRRE